MGNSSYRQQEREILCHAMFLLSLSLLPSLYFSPYFSFDLRLSRVPFATALSLLLLTYIYYIEYIILHDNYEVICNRSTLHQCYIDMYTNSSPFNYIYQ